MDRPSTPPLLAQLRDPSTSLTDQLYALRALKNQIVGHRQKKESWLKLGILDPVVRIITPRKVRQSGKGSTLSPAVEDLSDEDALRFQALCVVGSLAYGVTFPICQSTALLPAILANICPISNPRPVVSAALRSLSNIATPASAASATNTLSNSTLADILFSKTHLESFSRALSQSPTSVEVQSQVSTATSLVIKLCREERHQMALANAGVLDALAARLAEVIMAQGMAIPGAGISSGRLGRPLWTSIIATDTVDLAGILEAIAVIIADSKFRASQLVYSDHIAAVLPLSTPNVLMCNKSSRAVWSSFSASGLSGRQQQLSAVEYLIPHVPNSLSTGSSQAINFPPLGSGSSENLQHLGKSTSKGPIDFNIGSITPPELQDDVESPLIAYLFWLAKEKSALERLMAIFVLAVLYRAGLCKQSRESMIGHVIIPIMNNLIEVGNMEVPAHLDPTASSAMTAARWQVQERAPAILAMLMVDSEYLQKTAHSAGIITKLSKMIKIAYEPVLDECHAGAWSPTTSTQVTEGDTADLSYSQHDQLHPLLLHKIKVRESTLSAIAALVPFKDEYRKDLIDHGVVPYIVESLRPFPDKPSPKVMEKTEKPSNTIMTPAVRQPGYGTNPVSVLIAACGAVRHLSRSVSILRTTLIDNGVVMPVFDLLQHPDIEVQIAATAAVCNLVTDFSPMRETISAAGVLSILCEHAHSVNVKLRLNALWALKHLVLCADNEVKKTCLEELGQGWLVQLICADTEDETRAASQAPATSEDELMEGTAPVDQFDDAEYTPMADSIGALGQTPTELLPGQPGLNSRPSSRVGLSGQATARLAVLRDMEMNASQRARKDDIEVQEQGLEFIRNLIGHVNSGGLSETSEMIDFLFNALGQDQIFNILASKLQSKSTPHFVDDEVAGEPRAQPPQAEIVAAVGYILVHMAASVPRHRQLVISQTDLLKLVAQQTHHPSKEVRIAFCWLVINLTWMDDAPDSSACAHRAQELRKLGFLSKMEKLLEDTELDVRERAKVAIYQMKQHGC